MVRRWPDDRFSTKAVIFSPRAANRKPASLAKLVVSSERALSWPGVCGAIDAPGSAVTPEMQTGQKPEQRRCAQRPKAGPMSAKGMASRYRHHAVTHGLLPRAPFQFVALWVHIVQPGRSG